MVEGDRGRPKEGGGHTPLKISLDAEIMKALRKVQKRGPISRFVEDVIRPMARQYDPGPSSPLAKEILNRIKMERDEASRREDAEKMVALDYLLLRVKPILDPFLAMSEPDENAPSERKEVGRGQETTASHGTAQREEGLFSEEYTEAWLAGLYYTLDYLVIQLESVFSLSRNVVDMKFVKVIREPQYIDLSSALSVAGLVSDEFDLISHSQFAHELKERTDMVSRVLTKKYPKWMKELRRPPDTRTGGLELADYLLHIDIDQTTEHYKTNVVASMVRQFALLEKNLQRGRDVIGKLVGSYPELAEIVQLLEKYDAFFRPGFTKCKEYEEKERRRRERIREGLRTNSRKSELG